MLAKEVFDRLEEDSPEAAMVRSVLENAIPPETADEVFEEMREKQYERNLLFSAIVRLLSLVVCRVRPSLNAAYVACKAQLGVSAAAVYDKLNNTEPQISAALVNTCYQRMAPIVKELDACRPPLIAGYRTRIIDGNHLAATERRLQVLRSIGGAPLPGLALVVYDRELGLVSNTYLEEDAYVQERSLVLETLGDVAKGELWIADRNFCTTVVLFQIHVSQAAFIVRKHAQNVRYQETGRERKVGKTSTGVVYEQTILIEDDWGNTIPARRVRVALFEPTEGGDTEIVLLTNLPPSISALEVAEAYRKRWDIETTFNHMDRNFSGEIRSLAHPRAALLAFCLALIAYNTVSVVMASLRAVHGDEKVDEEVSPYYLGVYVQSDWRGLEMLWAPDEWTKFFSCLSPAEMADHLKHFARAVDLRRLPLHRRGPKKPTPKRSCSTSQPHVSTARVLAAAKLQL